MTFKRIAVSLCTIMICMMMFIGGYVKSTTLYSYAAGSNWQNVTTNEQLVQAFRAYCKSRDLTIEGSVADAVTTFTTKTFNGLCNTLGIDVTALQAHLKYETDGNNGLRFLFDSTGITAYNAIFAQFLQDNDISVGDDVNKNINDGEACGGQYIWKINIANNNLGMGNTLFNAYSFSRVVQLQGGYYQYSSLLNQGTGTLSFNALGVSANVYNVSLSASSGNVRNVTGTVLDNSSLSNAYNTQINGSYVLNGVTNTFVTSYAALARNVYNNHIILFVFTSEDLGTNYRSKRAISIADLSADNQNVVNNVYNVNVTITTNNNTVNNNNYEGDTIINNDGTPDNNNPDPDPDYDPYPDGGGTTTGPGTGGGNGTDGTITFPDLDLDLPSINWSLGDLSEKFPFSIPFDLIAFFTVLNAEPEAPVIDAEIPLGTWYTWHFEADFSQFDNYAVIIRNVEFIGFCVALIYLTIRLIKA